MVVLGVVVEEWYGRYSERSYPRRDRFAPSAGIETGGDPDPAIQAPLPLDVTHVAEEADSEP
jgi:hypothetical protein